MNPEMNSGLDQASLALAARAQDHVNSDRLATAIATLARFGGRDDGGVARQTLTPIDLEARAWLVAQARALGCEVFIDNCANLFFRRPGKEALPAVLTGSHVDTQPVGGKLDGAYGVLAGLEVIAALNDAGIQTRRPVEVVVWTNEEGSRFGPGTMGSSAYVNPGLLQGYRASTDGSGASFGDALDVALAAAGDLPRRAGPEAAAAFIELHIEQGPVLEAAGTPLGVVTGIQSVRWYRVQCTGVAAHAGTTPMDIRNDAMATAISLAQKLYAFVAGEAASNMKLTLGRWHVDPNSINTIPGKVEFTIDVRCLDESVLVRFDQQLHGWIDTHARRDGISLECFFSRTPTTFPQAMLQVVERGCVRACSQAGLAPPLRLTSGAFHDAMYLADHCPTAMIFTPSKAGISHNAAEDTDQHELYLGAQALAHVVTELANQ
ncbi:MAG: N-carbamoyl-L-amino acid hydrolase [Paucimonas sp.]|nr:N-carbamoyl-L-amino acid hydrolase [Paucimonas sp.]